MHVDTLRFLPWAITAIMVAVCALAWLKGGTAERIGAGLIAGFWVFQDSLQTLAGSFAASLPLVQLPILLGDFILATGFLVLALRFASLWLGVAMLAQGAQLGAHAIFIANGGHHADDFARWSNISSAVLLTSLLTGTLTCWRRRVVARRDGGSPAGPAS